MRTLVQWPSIVVAAVMLCTSVQAQTKDPPFKDQPDKKRSWLIDKDGQGATYHVPDPKKPNKTVEVDFDDKALADCFKQVLTKDGKPNVKNAAFFFNNCYGGGFLDDLKDALGNVIEWVGASATSHDQPAGSGKKVEPGNEQERGGTWIESLFDLGGKIGGKKIERGLLSPMQGDHPGVRDAVNQAHDMNPRKDKATGVDPTTGEWLKFMEKGQTVAGGANPDSIKMVEPKTASYHAVLWLGKADQPIGYNKMLRVREFLDKFWGGQATKGKTVQITTLYGDGEHQVGNAGAKLPAEWSAKPATGDNLRDTIKDLAGKLNEDEKFVFISLDHGMKETSTSGRKVEPVATGVENRRHFNLPQGDRTAMLLEPFNTPTLEIEYRSLITPVDVLLNGQAVGQLNPSLKIASVSLPVDEALLTKLNTISITNTTGETMWIRSTAFRSGAIGVIPVIPAPASVTSLIALGVCATRRRRSPAHAH